MAYLPNNFLRAALANYLDLVPSAIAGDAELSRDLGLEPLDLVLVLYRLEQFADVDLRVSDLEKALTVDDFERIVFGWLRESISDDDDLPTEPSRSGTHVIGADENVEPRKVRGAR